jgi:hypothetical protein
MKLLHVGNCHPRNTEFIIRACKLFNIEYHHTISLSFSDDKYDIIWSPSTWINPDRYPTSKFIFGPQFWVFPNPSDELFKKSTVEHGSRCIYVCLSDWIVTLYQEFADISKSHIPFLPIPFGLEDIVKKDKAEPQYDCAIYFKARHPSILEYCKSVVESRGLKYKLYTYGSYARGEYIETLKKTRFVIWIGSHESQGFAFQECLATGTPIYLYDVMSMKDEFNGRFVYSRYNQNLIATTAPYWSDACGMKVYSNDEFTAKLDSFIKALPSYDPAGYVQEKLNDKVCFQRFLDALKM